jgi:hypothetical protein
MAMGNTAIFFWATLLRAAALGPILIAAMNGASIEAIVGIAILGEIASLGMYLFALRNHVEPLKACLTRSPWLVGVVLAAVALPTMSGTIADLILAGVVGGVVAAVGLMIMPETRAIVLRRRVSWLDLPRPATQAP